MQRILVIGCGGAGKSTLAQRLGANLQLPVIHLDAHYWRPGWVEPSKSEWATTVSELLTTDAWIMDGNYSGSLAARLAACDSVIFIDLPRWLCIWRVLQRALRYRGTTRPDMGEGCPERLELSFLKWVWDYPRRTRPGLEVLLTSSAAAGKPVVRLRSAREVECFVQQLQVGEGSAA